MGQINDDQYNGLSSYTGALNDRLLAYYLANGATINCLPDAERQFLVANGATSLDVNDAWNQVLTSLGFTGSLTDKYAQFWATFSDAASLPIDATVILGADTYSATPSPSLVNTATNNARGSNLFRNSRRLFATSAWTRSLVTATDAATTSYDGATDATNLVCSAGTWALVPNYGSATFPAGTYTIACYVKRNDAVDQTFRLAVAANFSADKTATSAWQRFTHTFTAGATFSPNLTGLFYNAASGAANLSISDLELFAGSSDLGPVVNDGNMYFGTTAYGNKLPTYSGGELNMNGARGFMALSAVTPTSMTSQAVVKLGDSASGFRNWLSKSQSYTAWSAWIDQTNASRTFILDAYNKIAALAATTATGGPLWNPFYDGAYHLITQRYDSSTQRHSLWIDDVMVGIYDKSVTLPALQDFTCNDSNISGLHGNYKLFGIAQWNKALTHAEVVQSYQYWKSRMALASLTLNGAQTNRIYCSFGDSITGTVTYAYPVKYIPNASPAVCGTNVAFASAELTHMNTAVSELDIGTIPLTGKKCIMSILIGANDLATYTGGTDAAAAANYLTDYAAFCDAQRAKGWKVVVCTILPRETPPAHNTRRAIVNAEIVASWTGVHCDGVADFAADAIMGPDNSFATNPTYWNDATHPGTLGHDRLEAIIRPVLNGL